MQQVSAEMDVNFGVAGKKMLWNWAGDISTVPPSTSLEIGAITFNYFPSDGGVVGRCDAAGRDVGGNAVWRTQIVYVHPQTTVHLTFPVPLRLESGAQVEISFTSDGPGSIFVSMNGRLV